MQAFTGALAAHGIRWSMGYHVPEWDETPAGFHALLAGLFSRTPPTALLIDESPRVLAALAFFAEHGWRVPHHVSLIAIQADSSLAWCHPPLAHFHWDDALLIRRVVQWTGTVQRGRPDRRRVLLPAEFVPGGSIGPVGKK